MNQIGRRIYYEKVTGKVILDTGERSGYVVETTIDQDFETYAVLAERVRETVGVIQLEYGQYAADFAACNGFRVNPQTREIEFSYPDPQNPEAPPVFQRPLSEQIQDHSQRLADIELALAELFAQGGA